MNDYALTDAETLVKRSELVGYAVQAIKTDPALACDSDDERHLLASMLLFTRFCNAGRIADERRARQRRQRWFDR